MVLAGSLTMLGLALGLVHVLGSTPYTMVLFLGPGQLAILTGASLFLVVLALDPPSRLQSVVERRFERGEVVFRQGDYTDRLFLIGRGETKVVQEVPDGRGRQLAILKPIFSYIPSWKGKVGEEYARRRAMNLEAEGGD